MRGKSHICLGKYLITQYMNDCNPFQKKLFLFGCIQPDRNPFTYLKGSFRCRLLHGHNYCNANRVMERLANRLQKRSHLRLLDYYTLGKLIHYTVDSFTFTHNDAFDGSMSNHRAYEQRLQHHFLTYLNQNPKIKPIAADSIMDSIRKHHAAYSRQHQNIPSDCIYSLQACCCILIILFYPHI